MQASNNFYSNRIAYCGTECTTNLATWKNTGTAGPTHTWNTDFILAVNYQPGPGDSTTTRTASHLCDNFIKTLTSGSETSFVTENSFDYHYKCTYKLKTTANTLAPAFKLTAADFVKFQLHWVEYDSDSMGANAFLPATTASPTYIGDYADKEYPTPLATTTMTTLTSAEEFLATGESSLVQDYTPYTIPPGDISVAL